MVKAYSDASEAVLEKAEYKKKKKGVEIKVHIEYPELEQLKHYLKQLNGLIEEVNYKEEIEAIILLPKKEAEIFLENDCNYQIMVKRKEIIKEKYIDI